MRRLALGALLAAAATAPAWVWNPYYLHTLIMAGIFAVLALSLNLLLGYTGQLSLGHAAFFGLGAYATALLTVKLEWSPWPGLLAATVLPAGAGWVIGRLALKLRGAYFVLLTISFAGVVSLVSVNWMDLTNGPLGLPGVPPVELALPGLPALSLRTKSAYYYLVLAAVVLAYLVCLALVRSRVGRALVALRENETLAESVGIDGTHYLVLAAVISAGMAGLAGGLYAHYTRFVSPEVFLFSYTVTMVIMVVAGGKGTLAGPIVGAVIFTALPEALRALASWQWQMLLYGALLVAVLFFMPRGIVPTLLDRGRAAVTVAAALEVSELTVRFGGVTALGGVSFQVAPGTVTSLIGPNGAGKTTAFNVITGFQRPLRGRVSHDGVAITGWRPHRIAGRGVVRTFQRTSLFPALSVADNVLTGLHLRGRSGVATALLARRRVRDEDRRLREEAARVIDFVGLGGRRDDPATALSYGDQRLLELAVALAAGPRVLLLDEPASGMTASEKGLVADLIGRIRDGGVTIFLVEHDMRLVMGISDRVLVLNHGRLIADGTAAEVRHDPDVIRAYLGEGAHADA